ncbi:hypothetical protein [Denitromonas sp.]|uniref:lipopolysaccharide biosynthesis protein n=1 Tax=Denitromonas sp. TaxID=2734609 RepID=UPI002AFF9B32|nr:hypothetical protein [Denitromonas sp.]
MSEGYSRSAFKRNLFQYTGGRLLNALMVFAIFLWIARQLPTEEYANYVAAFALLEMGLVFSAFGMEWVTAVYIPLVRVKSTSSVLRRFVWSSAAVQAGLLCVGAFVLYAMAPLLAEWLGLSSGVAAFRVYSVVMFFEGLGRVFRDQLLACLMQQGAAQLSQMSRSVTMLVFAYVLFQNDDLRSAEGLAFAELIASFTSFCVAALLLRYALVKERVTKAADPSWCVPGWGVLLRTGRNAWLSNVANLSWGGQAVLLLATRLMGAEAAALLGFARNLSEQIRKYMPMEFLLGVVRTLLMARFAVDGDRDRLSVRAGLMYKANLLFVIPLLAAAIGYGDELCALASGGRYPDAQWFLVGWLCVLVLAAHHRLTDLLAHALGRSGLTSRASLVLIVVPFTLVLVLPAYGWWAMFAVLVIAEAAYSAMVLYWLSSPDWKHRLHWAGCLKIACGGVVGAMVLDAFSWGGGATAGLVALLVAFAVVWTCTFLLRAWSPAELGLLPQRFARAARHDA